MGVILVPYLPEKKVKYAIGDIEIGHINMIKPYRASVLPPSMRYHADLSICYLGNAVAVCAYDAYDYYKKALGDFPIRLCRGERSIGGNYPSDAAYNIAILNDKIFCKKSITDKVLLEEAAKMGYEIININQGYGKCSVCPVDEKSAISADLSFKAAAERAGVEVCEITNKNIILDGFSNGFFGGCAFLEEKKVLGINGNLDSLPEGEKIKNFLAKREIQVRSYKEAVCDFGSFIPIWEE